MMRFGIPEYRLPRSLIRAEVDKILALGVELRTRMPLTPEFGLPELRGLGYDAVFLAVGVSRGRDLQIPGVQLDGVVKAIDYLLNVNRGFRMDLGRRVVVIGGGGGSRFALRILAEQSMAARADGKGKRALVVGAGDVGALRGVVNNVSSALGAAFAGVVAVGLLAFFVGTAFAQSNLPASLKQEINFDRIDFISNDQLDEVLKTIDLTTHQETQLVIINVTARLQALKISFLILAGLALLAVIPAGGLPNYIPEELPADKL